MDFALTKEQQMLRDLFREFAEQEVAPRAEATDQSEEFPTELFRKAAAQGFLGATLPEAYGGAGLDYLTYTLLVEEISKYCLSTAAALGIHLMLSAMAVLDGGSEAVRRRYLPRMAGGELGTFAVTEPEAGSDPGSMQTTAVLDPDGCYRLNGVKSWVTNGGVAGVHVVLAMTTPGARQKGMSAFVVEARTPGVVVAHREPTLGMRGLDIRTVYFEDCRVPADHLLGERDHGWELVLRAFNRVRLSLAAAGLGAAEGALDLGLRFAVARKQFGVPIAQKQAIQNYVADCAVDIEALRHQVQYTAWLADTGQPDAAQSSLAKYLAARVARDTADKMLQVHVGYCFSD
jgi:alkylation response protein AidB-like acyl-CoA dehydrogenase